uniref:Uncharacterized protein n=1 Tax=Marseillevirus LCMAC103 TaxID=2506604 RepID=A0A481YVH7_9VIRU|nr:MAG: uncharacterized protein LCMAC103_01270 [Marseillevirus LCMAC103]
MAARFVEVISNSSHTVRADGGLIDATSFLTYLETTGGTAEIMPLNEGHVQGQTKELIYRAKGGAGDAVVTSLQMHDGTTITFTAVGDRVELLWDGLRWRVVLATDALGGGGPAVTGPPTPGGPLLCAFSSTDNAVVRFDGVTGCVIQDSTVLIDDAGNVTGVAALTAEEIRLEEPGGGFHTGFVAPALGANLIYTLPAADGAPGARLSTNGALGLSWAAPATPALAPVSVPSDAYTILIADLVAGLLRRNMGSADTWTLPTAALAVAGVPGAIVNTSLDFTIVNEDQGGAFDITLAPGADGTFVGNTVIPSASVTATTETSSATFRLIFTNVTATFETYDVFRK